MIEIGDENALALGQRRDEMAPSGETIAVMQPPRRPCCSASFGVIEAICVLGQPAGGVDDEAAALERMVADRHFDLLGEDRSDHRARKLRGVDFLVLRHQRVAGERVVVLPAGERADAADGGVDDREARAVALPQIIRSWKVGVILRRLSMSAPSASNTSCAL